LTVDKTTYTGDPRIKSSFMYPNNWRLEMVDVKKKDSGLYICQISSHPSVGLHTTIRFEGETCFHEKKNLKQCYIFFRAHYTDVSTSSTAIPHPKKFCNSGSVISLKCIIRCHLIENDTIQDITNVSLKRKKVLIDIQKQERIRRVEILSKHLSQIFCFAAWEWSSGNEHSSNFWRCLGRCRFLLLYFASYWKYGFS
jgi:hypothetical protein